jgi:hypothetical protein
MLLSETKFKREMVLSIYILYRKSYMTTMMMTIQEALHVYVPYFEIYVLLSIK